MVAVHLHLLPDGRVLSWGKQGELQLWDPATGGFTQIPSPDELFCAGHAHLPDGKLLIAGGHLDRRLGLPDINLFSGGGLQSAQPMSRGRWYPTVTTMANGQAVILAGSDQGGAHVLVPELWTSASAPPTRLTGASRQLPFYPRAFLAPNGRLFYAGEQATSRYLNTTGAGSWTTVATRRVANRSYGSAVMYEPGKMLYAGGGFTTNSAEVIDLNKTPAAWTLTSPMAFARRHHNLTVLPTGRGARHRRGRRHQLQRPRRGRRWRRRSGIPATGTWETLASNAVPRGYHGTSILLPDGRVLNAGSGDGEGPRQLNAELFSPPYLFAGSRPTIGAAPGVVGYGSSFQVATPDAAAIAKVSLIRLGSATHGIDMNQRYLELTFTRGSGSLTVPGAGSGEPCPAGALHALHPERVGRALGREDRAGHLRARHRPAPRRDAKPVRSRDLT